MNSGDRLGSYEILAPIGKGGMGEVWKARDTKLGRDVALKILPAAFASDPERMARFEREARVLASLDHPNIAAIYGLEDSSGIRALVLALVDGPTLADRIAAGPIPLDEAIQIARQIAEAVEYAHERGVIHRDLKPANIKITLGGMVKVLDFGLAKALDDEPAAASTINSPTLTMNATRAGVLLGTAAYMSPEQAKGKQADRRSDIWSFGAVLYEMVTGKPPFSGETVGDTLASVLKEEPKLDGVPAQLRGLVARCLNKDLRQRLQAIGEARIALENPAPATQITVVSKGRKQGLQSRVTEGFTVIFLLGLIALAFVHFRERQPDLPAIARLQIALPEKTTFANHLSISPDGKLIAFAATAPDHRTLLWLRPIDSLEAHPVPETDNAGYFFWSPDSRYVAYWAEGKVKKVSVAGGLPQTICDTGLALSGAWNRDGVILLGSNIRNISRVPAAGGTAVPLTAQGSGLSYQGWPHFLPDGKHFIYLSLDNPIGTTGNLEIAELDSKGEPRNPRRLATASSGATYVPSKKPDQGYLVFRQDNRLVAQAFDTKRFEMSSEAFPIAENVGAALTRGFFGASQTGTLVYRTGTTFDYRLSWFNRDGKRTEGSTADATFVDLSLSPEGTRAAVSRMDNGNQDIWLIDLFRHTNTRLTFSPALESSAVWSPDGKTVAYASGRDIFQRVASGAGEETPLLRSSEQKRPWDWSRDGRLLLYSAYNQKGRFNLWVLPMDGSGKPKPYLQSEFQQTEAQFSPDGHYVAYVSDESGRAEVYVQQYPVAGGKWQISTQGGVQPRWRADGKELFYLSLQNDLMAVSLKESARFEPGVSKVLFDSRLEVGVPATTAFRYSPTPDGKRFLVVGASSEQNSEAPFTVLLNWLNDR